MKSQICPKMEEKGVSIFLSSISYLIFINFISFITLIPAMLSTCWFITLFFRHVEEKHNDSFKELFKWYIIKLKSRLKK